MADQEKAAVETAYEAEPGTPPDGYSFIKADDLCEGWQYANGAVREAIQKWEAEGMTFGRLTSWMGEYQPANSEPGVWIEVWKTQPYKQADFNPPLVAA